MTVGKRWFSPPAPAAVVRGSAFFMQARDGAPKFCRHFLGRVRGIDLAS